MEPDAPPVINIQGEQYFAHELCIYLRRILFGYKALNELTYLDRDKVDKVLGVRKLPKPTERQEKLPFCRRSTKPCRRNLLERAPDSILEHCACPSRTCHHYYHIQDTVQFLEEITYLPLNYVHQPQPDPFPYIHRVRDTRVPTRRQIVHNFERNLIRHQVDEVGREIHEGWHDQEYRDLDKYYDSDGILLTPLTLDESLTKFFARLDWLSRRDEKTHLKVLSVTYNLLLACGGSTEDLLHQHIKKEYLVTVDDCTVREHEYWQVRTILTKAPKTLVSNRYPYHYSKDYNRLLHPYEVGTVPTISQPHQFRGDPVVVLGLLPGIHNQLISG